MKLPVATKLLLGIVSIFPLGFVFWNLVSAAFVVTGQAAFLSADDLMGKPFIDPWLVAVLVVSYALATIYGLWLTRASLPTGLKPLWVVALFSVPPVALPVFWFSYVWRTNG